MTGKKSLIIVMPVYNEEGAIAAVLAKWVSKLDSMNFPSGYEIHVYNDGSKDHTSEILTECGRNNPGKVIVHNKPNSGHGPTILQGYRENADKAEWLFQIDSDDEMGPESFDRLWDQREEHDFLVGIRDGRKQVLPRKIISLASRLSVRFFYGKSVWDVNTPYRLMRTSAFQGIYETIPADTFAPNVIISGMAARNELRCFECRVAQRERKTGTSSIKKWKLFNAAMRSFSETVEFALNGKRGLFLFWISAIISLLAKLAIASTGWNFDYESYRIVIDIMERGGNVYSETIRYNYGPVWFYILWFLSNISGSLFRYALPLFLGMVDIGIAGLLWRKFHFRTAAVLFLLSPLVIQISGFHNQFDNLAILLAMGAVAILQERQNPSLRRVLAASAMLGISLVTKHVFIFFVFWFLFRSCEWKKKLMLTFLPLMIFCLSFVPYIYPWRTSTVEDIRQDIVFMKQQAVTFCSGGMHFTDAQIMEIKKYANKRFRPPVGNIPAIGCMNNVFLYKSFTNSILYSYYLPRILQILLSPWILFIGGIFFSGWLCRKGTLFNALIFYTVSLVLFSTATVSQYLVIPSVFTCIHYLPLGLLYNLGPGVFLLFRPDPNQNLWIICIGLLLLMYIHFIGQKKTDM